MLQPLGAINPLVQGMPMQAPSCVPVNLAEDAGSSQDGATFSDELQEELAELGAVLPSVVGMLQALLGQGGDALPTNDGGCDAAAASKGAEKGGKAHQGGHARHKGGHGGGRHGGGGLLSGARPGGAAGGNRPSPGGASGGPAPSGGACGPRPAGGAPSGAGPSQPKPSSVPSPGSAPSHSQPSSAPSPGSAPSHPQPSSAPSPGSAPSQPKPSSVPSSGSAPSPGSAPSQPKPLSVPSSGSAPSQPKPLSVPSSGSAPSQPKPSSVPSPGGASSTPSSTSSDEERKETAAGTSEPTGAARDDAAAEDPSASVGAQKADQSVSVDASAEGDDSKSPEADSSKPTEDAASEATDEASKPTEDAASEATDEVSKPTEDAASEATDEASKPTEDAASEATDEVQGSEPAALASDIAQSSNAAQSVPPNFNEMTEQEQYDYLRQVTIEQAGGDESAWKTGEDEVNLIGIRSWQDGQTGSAEGNTYNDTIYAVRMHDGQPEVYEFEGSVDAGIKATEQGGWGADVYDPALGRVVRRHSHLADGYYEDGTFVETNSSTWGGHMVLGQGRDIRINVDVNNDGVIQGDERWNQTQGTNWQINFHPGGEGDLVGGWSAGCQIIRPDQYGLFERLLQDDPNWTHGYTLVDSANLPLRKKS